MMAFDIIFGEARATEHDQLFADAIQRARNVILFEYLTREIQSLTDKNGFPLGHLYLERRVPPIPLLAQAAVALAPFPLLIDLSGVEIAATRAPFPPESAGKGIRQGSANA